MTLIGTINLDELFAEENYEENSIEQVEEEEKRDVKKDIIAWLYQYRHFRARGQPTSSFLDDFNVGVLDGDLSGVNLRRKHPKLGKKIAEITHRLDEMDCEKLRMKYHFRELMKILTGYTSC